MAALWLWARTDWRNRWRALIGLAVLITLAAGITLGVAGGARRAASAVDRHMAATNTQNVGLAPDEGLDPGVLRSADFPTPAQLADEVAAVPGVRGVTVASFIAATPDPDGDFFNMAMGAERGEAPTQLVVQGRLPSPGAPDEVLVNEFALEAWKVDLGDTMTLHTLDPSQWDTFAGLVDADPGGPEIEVQVVGVMRDLESITDRPEPVLGASPAFLDRWGRDVLSVPVALVNADPDRIPEVVAALEDIGGDLLAAGPVDEDYVSRIADTIDVEVTALWAFTAAAAAAGLLIIGQALTRHAADNLGEHSVRSAVGFSPRQQVLGSVLTVAPALVAGVVGAVALTVALSPLLPRGVARLAEVDTGVRVDRPVLVIGGGAVAVAVLLTAVAAASLAGRGERRRGIPRPSRFGELSRLLPAVPALGTRLALGGGSASSGAAWAGVGAVAVGVAGVLAVGTVERSVHHLLTTPTLFGAPWDAEAELDAVLDEGIDEGIEALGADPDVALVASVRQPLVEDGMMEASGPSGQARVEPFTFDVTRGPVPLVVAEGRVPGPGEAAVGAEVLDRLGARIGDQVVVAGSAGPVPMTIVGRTINAGSNELDQGFYVPPETLDRLLAGCPSADDIRCQTETFGVGVGFRDGADRNAALARARAIVPDLQPTPRPSVVDSLGEIGSTPTWLGVFLGLLGLAGLIHALIVGGRRSEHDLAVSRALGLRPRQASRAIAWGAGLVAAAGAVIGVALGLLLGRLVWQRVVDGVGSLLDTETPRGLLVAVPAGAVLVAVMVAIVPGHRAASLRPGDALRAE
jgi:hypothetical protein